MRLATSLPHHGVSGRIAFGGAKGIRTLDPYVANVMLYQLSYRPIRIPVSNVLGTLPHPPPPCKHYFQDGGFLVAGPDGNDGQNTQARWIPGTCGIRAGARCGAQRWRTRRRGCVFPQLLGCFPTTRSRGSATLPGARHGEGRASARPRLFCLPASSQATTRSRNPLHPREMPGKELVVSFVQSRVGRAASPLAAGNRDMQVNVMGGADASRPESGGKCVRTFPAPPFGMTGSGGQGLPALPRLGNRKVFA